MVQETPRRGTALTEAEIARRRKILSSDRFKPFIKLELLAESFRIPKRGEADDETRYFLLALLLAEKYVPGFADKLKRGPKTKTTPEALTFLLLDVEMLKRQGRAKTDTQALGILRKENPGTRWPGERRLENMLALARNPKRNPWLAVLDQWTTGLGSREAAGRKFDETLRTLLLQVFGLAPGSSSQK